MFSYNKIFMSFVIILSIIKNLSQHIIDKGQLVCRFGNNFVSFQRTAIVRQMEKGSFTICALNERATRRP